MFKMLKCIRKDIKRKGENKRKRKREIKTER